MAEETKRAISKPVLVLVLVAVVIISAVGIYYYQLLSPTGQKENSISLAALSVNPSTSNMTATVNVRNTTAINRMSLYVNRTFFGSHEYPWNGAGHCCARMTSPSGSSTWSFYYTATPSSLPMMGSWDWTMMGGGMMGGSAYQKSYMVTLMATFANGSASNATAIIVPNQQGNAWMMR